MLDEADRILELPNRIIRNIKEYFEAFIHSISADAVTSKRGIHLSIVHGCSPED